MTGAGSAIPCGIAPSATGLAVALQLLEDHREPRIRGTEADGSADGGDGAGDARTGFAFAACALQPGRPHARASACTHAASAASWRQPAKTSGPDRAEASVPFATESRAGAARVFGRACPRATKETAMTHIRRRVVGDGLRVAVPLPPRRRPETVVPIRVSVQDATSEGSYSGFLVTVPPATPGVYVGRGARRHGMGGAGRLREHVAGARVLAEEVAVPLVHGHRGPCPGELPVFLDVNRTKPPPTFRSSSAFGSNSPW